MSYDTESLYALLPAYLRTRDERLGQQLRAESTDDDAGDRPDLDYAPLHALVSVFATELQALQQGTDQLYDDLFIETCAEWVIPYIGELVGVRLPPAALRDELNPRALVADAIADRRRKGTIGGLERVADAAVASWVAKATEYWRLLIQSQNLNHLRPDNVATINVRDLGTDHLIGTPFDESTRSVDSRSAADGGRYAIATIGIDVWRTTSQRRRLGLAARHDARRMRFDPMGRDIALATNPAPLVGEDRVERRHLSQPLTRWALHHNLARVYPRDVEIVVDGAPVPADDVVACLLEDDGAGGWLNAGATFFAADPPHARLDPALTRIDPELGRFVLGETFADDAVVEVTYHYGDALGVGGGSYGRDPAKVFDAGVLAAAVTVAVDGLRAAVTDRRDGGMVIVDGSGTTEQVSTIVVDPDAELIVFAADGEHPLVKTPTLTARMFPGSTLVLDGLLIDGDIEIVKPESGPAEVALRDCTVRPGGHIRVVGPALTVHLERSVVGAMLLSQDTVVVARDSVIDATDPTAIALSGGGGLTCHETTVIGRIEVDRLDLVSNSMLVATRASPGAPAPVRSRRRQVGCVRFSWLPPDSETPQRYRCVPTDAGDTSQPIFVTQTHGQARYLQLDGRTSIAITQGSEEQSEMGVLHRMHQHAREIVLADRLEEFLRFGMEAGVHVVS